MIHRHDSTLINRLRRMGLVALLASLWLAAPASAQAPTGSAQPPSAQPTDKPEKDKSDKDKSGDKGGKKKKKKQKKADKAEKGDKSSSDKSDKPSSDKSAKDTGKPGTPPSKPGGEAATGQPTPPAKPFQGIKQPEPKPVPPPTSGAPVQKDPMTGADDKPATPVVDKPITPGAEKPVPPGADKPVVPATGQPSGESAKPLTPPAQKPAEGAASRPGGPVTTLEDPALPKPVTGKPGGTTTTEKPGAQPPTHGLPGDKDEPKAAPGAKPGTSDVTGSTPPGGKPSPGAAVKGAAPTSGNGAPAGPSQESSGSQEHLDAERKTYDVISMAGDYATLLDEFGRQSGLTPTGDIPAGQAFYPAPASKQMSWQEAFRRVKTAIWQADVLNRRTIIRDGDYLVVLSVNDYWRQMPPEYMYTSVEEMRAADPHDDELVYVQYTMPVGTAANLELLRSFVPDYARIAPVAEGSSVIGIYAKVSDIKKYLTMSERFLVDVKDPRRLEHVACKHILPSQAVETIDRLIAKPGKTPARPSPGSKPGTGSRPSQNEGLSLSVGEEPESIFMPNDDRKEILAYALPLRLEEFKQFLADLDIETEQTKRTPVVIAVEHADAAELARTIENILDAEEGKGVSASGGGGEGPAKPGASKSSANSRGGSTHGGVVILPMADWNQLVVIGPDDGISRVRDLVEMFDQPAGEVALHVVEIKHKTPTFIVGLLMNYDQADGSPVSKAIGGSGKGPKASPASAKFNPDDENGKLYILCAQREWEVYKELIHQLDIDDGTGAFTRIELQHIDPADAIERVNQFLGSGGGAGPQPRGGGGAAASGRKMLAGDRAILVYGAGASELEQIRQVVGVLDQPSEQVEKTFVLEYAEPQTIIGIIEAMVLQSGGGGAVLGGADGPAPKGRPSSRGSTSSHAAATLYPLDNRLLVKASATTMEKIEAVVKEFDVPPTEGTETRVYEFAEGTDVQAMADTLQQVIPAMTGEGGGAAPVPGRGQRGPGAGRSGGPQFIPQASAGKLIVIAEKAVFPKIDEMIEHLKVEGASVRAMRHVPLKKAQPKEIAATITAMMRSEPGGGVPMGGGAKKGGGGGGSFFIDEAPGGHAVVMHGAVAELDQAQKWIEQLDTAALTGQQVKLYHINNADPKQLVDLIINVIDSGAGAGAGAGAGKSKAPKAPATPKGKESSGGSIDDLFGPSEEPEWESSRTYVSKELYLQADYWEKTILIVTSPAKLDEIDSLLDKLDPTSGESPLVDKPEPYTLIYELTYAEAFDASIDIDTYLEIWGDNQPTVSYDDEQNTLIIRHPRTQVLDEVEKVIRTIIDRPKDPGELRLEKRIIPVPINYPVMDAAQGLKVDTGKKLTVEIKGSADEDKEYGIGRVVPRVPAKSGDAAKSGEAAKEGSPSADASKTGGSGCVLPSSLSMGAASRVMLAAALVDDEDPRSGKRKKKAQEAQDEKSGKKDRKDSKRGKSDEADGDAAGAADGSVAPAAPSAGGDSDIKPTPPAAQEDSKLPGMTDTSVEDDPFLSSLAKDQSHIRTVTRDEKAIAAGEPGTMEEIKVWVDPVTNTIVVEGTTEDVKKIEEMVAELVKGQPTTKPDIRVYRVKYIDPVLAKDIIEEMFGAGSRNMANVMRQQQQQAAAAAARAAAARGGNVPGAPNARGGGGGREEERGGQPQIIPGLPGQQGRQPGQPGMGEDGGQQNQNQQFLQQMTQQQSAAEIKVYANPRDRTLVFRAPTGLYPAILELLATVDQPQEVTSTFRIFTLKKLQAEDAEKKLRSFLNLDEKPKGAEERLRDIESMGGQMPEPVRDSQGNEITPNQIRITSNPMANTIIAMAPPEALEYIGKLIESLESFEMPERLVEWIPLANSLAGEVVDMLDKHFAEDKSAAPGATGGKKGAAMPATGSKTNVAAPPPSFLPYTRLNVVVVRATEEQMKEVKEVIAKLDVPPEGSQYESVQITCADAGALAQQLGQMFGAAAEGGKGKGAGTTSGAKFFASGEGNMLFYSVPNSIKPEVLATIEKIDQQQCMQQEVRIIELKFGTPSQVAEAVNMAYGGGGGKTAKKGGAGGGRIVVAGHDATRRLFVAAPNETAFQEVAALVLKLDVPTDLKFAAYHLNFLNARSALGLMQGLIQQYGIRPGKDAEKFAVDADEATNSLIVLGGLQTHAFVEEAIKIFDTEERRVGNVVTVIYQLKQANATELAKNINATYGATGKGKDGGEVKAEANQALNALIVVASEKMQKQIEDTIIKPMDGMTPPGLLSEVIVLVNVHPDLMAEKIRALVNEQIEGKKIVQQKNAIGTTVVISSDPDTRQLLVLADKENMEFIKSRVALLDTPETSLKEGLITRKYPVQWADPNVLKGVIDEWTATRTGKGKTGKQQVQTSARDLVLAYVDGATSSLIVTASSENQDRIVALLKEIDVDTGLGSQREVVFLKNANAAELQQAIAPSLAKSGSGNKRQPGQQLTVTAVPQLNALLIQGGPKDIDETKQLIAKLDLPPNEDAGVIIKVYPLQFLDPQFVVNMVNQAFTKTGSKRPEDTIKAAWTPPSNLIIGASNENHIKIAALLKELDVESSAQRQIHTIKLTYASAMDLAQNLSQLIQNTQQKKKTEVQPMYITGETGTNSLIVYANDVEMKWVQELLTKLDVAEVTSGRTIKSFQLTYADPNSVAQAITQVFGQSAPGGGKKNPQDQVIAFPEYGSRSVIVATSPRMLEDVKRLVAELDTSEGADRPIRVVAIKNVDPEGIQQVLQDLFSGGANPFGGGRGMRGGGFFSGGSQATGGMVIALVPGTNNIVIRASEEEFTKIMDVINQIDVDLAKKQDIRIFLLKNINAQEAQEALQSYLERPGAGSSMSSMFRGRGGSSRGALTGDARVTVLASSNGLVVTADREAIDGIAAVIQQLDSSAEGPNKPRIISVLHANVADIEPMVNDLFLSDSRSTGRGGAPSTPKPIIVADPQLNALIVRAADTDFEAIKEIVEYLDKAERLGATFKIIQVPPGFGVADMAAQISDAINKGQQGQSSTRGSSKATSVTITPNARTHSLIVTGAPTLFPQVEQMVEQLASMGPPGGVATRIIPIKTMSLEEVQKIIELLKQQEEGQSSGSTRRR